jgi:CRISPR-associated protein Csb2
MALAAAWFETGQDDVEGETLRWLERIGPPDIAASEAEFRDVVASYVPVNDSELAGSRKRTAVLDNPRSSLKNLEEAGLTVTPEFRPRRERHFPVAIPHEPVVYLIWDQDVPEIHRDPLAYLCSKVVSIGHSASLVQMWLTDSPPMPTLVVRRGVTRHRLRVFGPGRLDYLSRTSGRESHIALVDDWWTKEQAAKGREGNELKRKREAYLHGIVQQLRPEPGQYEGYDRPPAEPGREDRGSIFDSRLVVLGLSCKRLSLLVTLRLTEALRGALMSSAPHPVPEWLSGHAPNGARSENPHLAFVPLAFVGWEHADGRLLGVALALPRGIAPDEVARVLDPWLRDGYGLARQHRLFDGQWFECGVELETRESPPLNLRQETWTRSAHVWATVTPVVLDRHFDGKNKWRHATENVKDACEHIGLPRPQEVLLHPVSLIEGVPRSTEFPHLTRKKDGGRMHHVHAVIVFEENVKGPVLVGAGRFRGYGLCRPLRQEGR